MFLSAYRQKTKEEQKQKGKKLAEDSTIWSWLWHCFQWRCHIGVVPDFLKKFYFYRAKKAAVKNGKGSHGKDVFSPIPDFLKQRRRPCVLRVCVHAPPYTWSEWREGRDNGSELVLKLLQCEKHTISLLSSSVLSLFLKSLQYCNKPENYLNKNKKILKLVDKHRRVWLLYLVQHHVAC